MSADSVHRTIYSFVVDAGATFAYHGWHLAASLCVACKAAPGEVHVQFTDLVRPETIELFALKGYRVHFLQRFGDGRWCNKLAQLRNLAGETFDVAVLLDTDMIAVADLRPFLRQDAVLGKVVDFPNPPLPTLLELFRLAGAQDPPQTIRTEAVDTPTLVGNCNGGFYAVPKSLADRFDAQWRRWATWLFEHGAPLHRAGRMKNVDQVSAAMAVQISGIPFAPVCGNVNYFLHLKAPHSSFDPSKPLALLHYHGTMNDKGLVAPKFELNAVEAAAVGVANACINTQRHPRISWT